MLLFFLSSLAMAASLPTLWSFEILSSNIKGGSEKNLYYLNISLGDLRYSTYSTEVLCFISLNSVFFF